MRHAAWLCTLVLVSLLTAARAADEKVDLTGQWDFELELMGMTGTPEFTFKQEGEKLTGTYKGQFGEAELTGTVKGSDIEFSFEIQAGATATYKGKIEKDGTLKGEANYADQATGPFTAKRKKE